MAIHAHSECVIVGCFRWGCWQSAKSSSIPPGLLVLMFYFALHLLAPMRIPFTVKQVITSSLLTGPLKGSWHARF